jgi:DNA-binding response OmpR family regulator
MARILLVDDEPNIRFLYSTFLADGGHEVIEAQSGSDALKMIQREPLDLVVLDIKLGSENGLTLLQEIAHRYPSLPVIILTAYVSFQDDYTSWLADSYILKSGDPNEFLRAVDETLQQVRPRPARSPWQPPTVREQLLPR